MAPEHSIDLKYVFCESGLSQGNGAERSFVRREIMGRRKHPSEEVQKKFKNTWTLCLTTIRFSGFLTLDYGIEFRACEIVLYRPTVFDLG